MGYKDIKKKKERKDRNVRKERERDYDHTCKRTPQGVAATESAKLCVM